MSVLNFWSITNSLTAFWKKPQSETYSPSGIKRTTSPVIDFTEDLVCNYSLTHGLYHNTYPGIKLAGFGFNAINVPVSFMGLPTPAVESNDQAQEQLDLIVENFTDKIKDIHTQCHREGTIWIYPIYSKKTGLDWEFIRDDTVSKIIRDINTKELISIETTEQIKFSKSGSDNTYTTERKRVFTKTKVSTTYTGDVPPTVKNKNTRNPAGILPVVFANNNDGNEIRGFSDYERIVSDLKDYHDLSLAESSALCKFNPKLVQYVKDFQEWKSNNGYSTSENDDGQSVATLDISAIDFIVNMVDEKTELLLPDRITASYQAKLKQIFRKIVELSGIPEIAWGLKTAGNLASVEENMAILMRFVADKQQQKVTPYQILFDASLRLLQTARVITTVSPIKITWNNLDNLSAKTKSEIFKNTADALSKIVDKAIWTKQMLHEYMLKNYPEITPIKYETFEAEITEMTAHNARAKASIEEQLLSQGLNTE